VSSSFLSEDHRKADFSTYPWLTFPVLGQSVHPQLSEDVTAYVERMMLYVHDQFGYDRATTHVHSTIDDILTLGGGVCQDFAHLSIGLLRLAGIPTRYVSGYLAPDLANPVPTTSPRLASHAWIEALLPGAGWTGFDPTHRIRTTLRHIRVAVGRDFSDLPMISGIYHSGGGLRRMTYELQIRSAGGASTKRGLKGDTAR
jgi:transglutaminase-like putative cysteine protease